MVRKERGAACLRATLCRGILKAFSVVHQSVERAAKKTMETVRQAEDLGSGC